LRIDPLRPIRLFTTRHGRGAHSQYIAGEFQSSSGEPATVIIYQSALFESVMPEATERFRRAGVGELRVTPGTPGDEPVPGKWDQSLLLMRDQMFRETDPVASIFVGGMEGIRQEYDLLKLREPKPQMYPIGRPGGEAARLVAEVDSEIRGLLATGDVYPFLFAAVLANLASHLG
jgi:hypothetical protein